MNMLRFATILAVLLGASAALAQDFARPGAYAQLNGVASFESIDGVPSSALDTGIGVSGRLGYRFDPLFSVEAQVEYSGDFVDCCGVDLSATLVTANAKLYFLRDQFQPYGLIGMGGAFGNVSGGGLGSADDNGFAFKVGGGLDFYFNERMGLMFEVAYNLGTGDLDDFAYTGLGWGAFYRF